MKMFASRTCLSNYGLDYGMGRLISYPPSVHLFSAKKNKND